MPHFKYCSSVWHFCGVRSAGKIDTLNKRILRFILQDYNSPYALYLANFKLTPNLCIKDAFRLYCTRACFLPAIQAI